MSEENDYFDEEFAPEDKKKAAVESADEKELRELEKVTINMKYNWLRIVAAVVGVLFVVGAVLWVWMYFWVPVVSEQEQVGYVDEVRCEGRIFKTFEGKLLTVGMLYDSVPDITREFTFSIDNDSVARDLMRLQKTGRRVALSFKEYEATLPWRGNSTRMVVGFEER
ncbi:MAG: hypothetical protein PUD91_08710 [Bacteroidales bacterium]|nr:hypothetical protein [Bacteroidales bacterium]